MSTIKIFPQILLGMCLTIGITFSMGCVTSGKTKISQPVSNKLGHYKVLALDSSIASSSSPDDKKILSLLDGKIIAKLRETHLFEKVYSIRASLEEEGDLRLLVTILGANFVSANSRTLLGSLAGQAFLKADLSLIESKTENVIGKVQVEGKSSAGYSAAGDTSQAIDRLVEEIVTYVIRHY